MSSRCKRHLLSHGRALFPRLVGIPGGNPESSFPADSAERLYFDEYQVYEAAAIGADAALLIAAVLPPERLAELYRLAYSLGLEVLVEVHDREELESVAFLQPQILGVNNRNLKTFEVNLDTVAKLRPYAPENAVFVSESGIRNHADMQMVRQLGADAVLIGETLMRSGNVTETLHQLREGI